MKRANRIEYRTARYNEDPTRRVRLHNTLNLLLATGRPEDDRGTVLAANEEALRRDDLVNGDRPRKKSRMLAKGETIIFGAPAVSTRKSSS